MTLKSMLRYFAERHRYSAYDLEQYEINTKSKADMLDAIKTYGWYYDYLEYIQ